MDGQYASLAVRTINPVFSYLSYKRFIIDTRIKIPLICQEIRTFPCVISKLMDEKNILREVKIRPIRKEEFSLWKELMNKYHYLGYKRMPGKNIHYIATLRDRWVALLG